MEIQKVLIRIAYFLVGLSILVLIVLTIYSHYLMKKQTEGPTTENVTKIESPVEPVPNTVEEKSGISD